MAGRFRLGEQSIHGPAHWERVERHAVALATHGGGDQTIVRLFALFHDVCRWSDGGDHEHGARGAALAAALRGTWLDLPDERFQLLEYACIWHTFGQVSDDPTIGACWDADRLDIWRAGIMPVERYMSTEFARELVRTGRIGPDHTPIPVK